MFARLAQITAKPGQASNVSQAARDRLIPMLKQQPGFIDTLGLNSDTDPNQFVGITLWNSKEDGYGRAPHLLRRRLCLPLPAN
jgi:heme-degrading monooxygenase HmoA